MWTSLPNSLRHIIFEYTSQFRNEEKATYARHANTVLNTHEIDWLSRSKETGSFESFCCPLPPFTPLVDTAYITNKWELFCQGALLAENVLLSFWMSSNSALLGFPHSFAIFNKGELRRLPSGFLVPSSFFSRHSYCAFVGLHVGSQTVIFNDKAQPVWHTNCCVSSMYVMEGRVLFVQKNTLWEAMLKVSPRAKRRVFCTPGKILDICLYARNGIVVLGRENLHCIDWKGNIKRTIATKNTTWSHIGGVLDCGRIICGTWRNCGISWCAVDHDTGEVIEFAGEVRGVRGNRVILRRGSQIVVVE